MYFVIVVTRLRFQSHSLFPLMRCSRLARDVCSHNFSHPGKPNRFISPFISGALFPRSFSFSLPLPLLLRLKAILAFLCICGIPYTASSTSLLVYFLNAKSFLHHVFVAVAFLIQPRWLFFFCVCPQLSFHFLLFIHAFCESISIFAIFPPAPSICDVKGAFVIASKRRRKST